MDSTKELYDSKALELMRLAEASLDKGADRLTELRNFAIKAGIKKIGLAYCMAVAKEAEAVADYLSQDFEVLTVGCKIDRITKGEMLEQEGLVGLSCNPLGQAAYLAENGSQMNIVLGLCVGHDMLFTMNSGVPTTTLLVKDRAHKHNTMETIHGISQKVD